MKQILTQDLILKDSSSTGRVRPWKENKIHNEYLSLVYDQIDVNKAERLRDCASALYFSVSPENTKKLVSANFCRVRLCPICQWRRSLKTFSQMSRIMAAVEADKPRAYLMLTLTVRNCQPDQLNDRLDQMSKAFHLMKKYKRFVNAVQGWYRGTEITHNLTENTYHPHFHVVLAVDRNYFKDSRYIPHAEWVQMWKRAMRLDYDPNVDVRRVKGNDPESVSSAIAEVAKYTVKGSDYLIPDDWDLTLETVALLDQVLNKRRFIGFGGIFKDWHKKLNLDDPDDGDLVHTDDEPPPSDLDPIVVYQWSTGYKQYVARFESN